MSSALGVLLIAGLAVLTAGSAAAQPVPRPYLALGDSIAFGFVRGAGAAYANADGFTGYPAYVAQTLGFDAVDAACPGETTGSFLARGVADLGCAAYRAAFPLHTGYGGLSQLQFAGAFLAAHPGTRLVTIGLGTNDLQMIESACAQRAPRAGCVTGGLATVTANLTTIVRSLRAAGYTGIVMLVDVYAIDFTDAADTQGVAALNAAIRAAATATGVPVVDAFTAFRRAAAATGGHTCATGLLMPGPSSPAACDLHPTAAGQRLLASVVEQAYRAAAG